MRPWYYICGLSAPECALPGVLQRLLPLQALARLGCQRQRPLAVLQRLGQRPVINNTRLQCVALLSAPTNGKSAPKVHGQVLKVPSEVLVMFQEAEPAGWISQNLKVMTREYTDATAQMPVHSVSSALELKRISMTRTSGCVSRGLGSRG